MAQFTLSRCGRSKSTDHSKQTNLRLRFSPANTLRLVLGSWYLLRSSAAALAPHRSTHREFVFSLNIFRGSRALAQARLTHLQKVAFVATPADSCHVGIGSRVASSGGEHKEIFQKKLGSLDFSVKFYCCDFLFEFYFKLKKVWTNNSTSAEQICPSGH